MGLWMLGKNTPNMRPGLVEGRSHTVDDRNPALPLRTLNYGNYGIFLITGNAGFISSTVGTWGV